MNAESKKILWSFLAMAGAGGLMVVLFLKVTAPKDGRGYAIIATKVEMRQLANALCSYESTYRRFPTGSPSQMVESLMGNNPQGIHFLNVGIPLKHDGQLRDRWEIPYRITFESSNHFTIRSAGENMVFGDKDDLEEKGGVIQQ
jgi:hypothetical protein